MLSGKGKEKKSESGVSTERTEASTVKVTSDHKPNHINLSQRGRVSTHLSLPQTP